MAQDSCHFVAASSLITEVPVTVPTLHVIGGNASKLYVAEGSDLPFQSARLLPGLEEVAAGKGGGGSNGWSPLGPIRARPLVSNLSMSDGMEVNGANVEMEHGLGAGADFASFPSFWEIFGSNAETDGAFELSVANQILAMMIEVRALPPPANVYVSPPGVSPVRKGSTLGTVVFEGQTAIELGDIQARLTSKAAQETLSIRPTTMRRGCMATVAFYLCQTDQSSFNRAAAEPLQQYLLSLVRTVVGTKGLFRLGVFPDLAIAQKGSKLPHRFFAVYAATSRQASQAASAANFKSAARSRCLESEGFEVWDAQRLPAMVAVMEERRQLWPLQGAGRRISLSFPQKPGQFRSTAADVVEGMCAKLPDNVRPSAADFVGHETFPVDQHWLSKVVLRTPELARMIASASADFCHGRPLGEDGAVYVIRHLAWESDYARHLERYGSNVPEAVHLELMSMCDREEVNPPWLSSLKSTPGMNLGRPRWGGVGGATDNRPKYQPAAGGRGAGGRGAGGREAGGRGEAEAQQYPAVPRPHPAMSAAAAPVARAPVAAVTGWMNGSFGRVAALAGEARAADALSGRLDVLEGRVGGIEVKLGEVGAAVFGLVDFMKSQPWKQG